MREVKLEDIFETLKKNFRFILIITLLTTLVSVGITLFLIPPKYEASTKVYIGKEQFKNLSTNYTNEEVNMYHYAVIWICRHSICSKCCNTDK